MKDDLTVINFVWAPYMTLLPHNHNMFAVIGIYSGREDNMFWRRIDKGAGDGTGPGIAGPLVHDVGRRHSRGRERTIATHVHCLSHIHP